MSLRPGRQLPREVAGPKPGLHFPRSLARRKRRRGGSAAEAQDSGGRRRREALPVAAMDVTGPETDWRSTNFRQKLVSQM